MASETVYQWTSDDAVKVRYRIRRVRVAPSREAAYGPHHCAEVYEPRRGWTGLLAEPGVLKELVRLVRERDLAVAHDRQPYPTADAYEKVCAALAASRERIAAMRAHLLARSHKADCMWTHPSYGPDYGCSCGWLAALGEEAKDATL